MVWNKYTDDEKLIDLLVEEAARPQQVDSDSDPVAEKEKESTETGSEDKIEEIIDKIHNGQLSDEDLKKMVDSKEISEEELQKIMGMLDQNGDGQISQEELIAQQIDQVNDTYIRFTIYDKIVDLLGKIDNYLEDFGKLDTENYKEIERLREFLKVLMNLTFTLDINVVYQMYGTLEIRLITIFEEELKLNGEDNG